MLLKKSCDVELKSYFRTQIIVSPSRWPRGLRRRSVAARLLGLRVSVPSEALMSVALSGRGLCVRLISRPQEFYRVLCV